VQCANVISRSKIVRARRVRLAERITRQRGGARSVRGAIGRADWPGRTRRARRTRCRLDSSCARGDRIVCSVQRGLCNGPVICLEGRVLSAEIFRSRFLENVSEYPRAEYARRRSCDPGISDAVFGVSESRVRSAEILRSRCLGCGSDDPRVEYSRRRSFDPGISESGSDNPRVEYSRRRSFDPGISESGF